MGSIQLPKHKWHLRCAVEDLGHLRGQAGRRSALCPSGQAAGN